MSLSARGSRRTSQIRNRGAGEGSHFRPHFTGMWPIPPRADPMSFNRRLRKSAHPLGFSQQWPSFGGKAASGMFKSQVSNLNSSKGEDFVRSIVEDQIRHFYNTGSRCTTRREEGRFCSRRRGADLG
jgi:hypothetical protein